MNLTYDDIQLVPQFSNIESRSFVKLDTRLSRNYKIMIPFVGSPMDTVCESEMAIRLLKCGGVGCIHRFMSIEEQVEETKIIEKFLYRNKEDLLGVWGETKKPIMAAIGATGDYLKRAQKLVMEGAANVLLIDVAHGHHINVKKAIEELIDFRTRFKLDFNVSFDIIAGNIATYQAAVDLIEWGADGLRVGIGGGSLCTTRIETGHGIPNVSALEEVSRASIEYDVPIMADGGIRTAGDAAKAIAVGADSVMLGSLLSGTEETPGNIIEKGKGLYKRYRGSASIETKTQHGQRRKNVEGESTTIPFKGSAKYAIERLRDGLSSALSYTGANTLEEYKLKAEYVQVTNAGAVEASPHLL